jgi:hypothetical protein
MSSPSTYTFLLPVLVPFMLAHLGKPKERVADTRSQGCQAKHVINCLSWEQFDLS